MGLISRPFHYHVWHRSALDGKPAWSSTSITVPRIGGSGTESKTVYSLKKDMDELRKRGAAKSIVDASITDVGKSTHGKELWALKVGLGSQHKVLFVGCHHAREWISVEVPYLVAEYLIESYRDPPTTDKEKRIKHLLQNRQIWFVPMVNPDGHDYTMTTDRNWRPSRKAHAVSAGTIHRSAANGGDVSYPTGTYTGVDINRNYATADWGTETFHRGNVKTSRDPRDSGADSVWCGLAGSGEAESAAIDALIAAQKFRAAITYHSFSQLLLYPDASAANDFVQWVGKGMRDLINAGGNPYTYESGSMLYRTSGDMMDLTYERQPGRPAFTPELRPTYTAANRAKFFSGLPENEIQPCFNENLAAALALINCAGHDAKAGKHTVSVKTDKPPAKVQLVRHCWEVFRGWTP